MSDLVSILIRHRKEEIRRERPSCSWPKSISNGSTDDTGKQRHYSVAYALAELLPGDVFKTLDYCLFSVSNFSN